MISVEHLTKCYGGFKAVDDLSFEIDEGHVYGFLGPNGAGKSTTMNIMTGCLSATEGSVKIDGYDIFEDAGKAKKLIEYLRFVGEAKGLHGAELESQIEEVIRQTKIGDVKGRRISSLSKGYKQRVGIAQALLGNPRVIVLDEPTVGLDPMQIIEIRALIKELGQTHTVIFSSHILSEVQTICDRILIISKGRLVAFDEPENLEKRLLAPNEITITADSSQQEIREILSSVKNISDVRIEARDERFVQAHIKTDCEDIFAVSRAVFFAFSTRKTALLEMSLKKANLEDVFIELTENDGEKQPPEGRAQTAKEGESEGMSK